MDSTLLFFLIGFAAGAAIVLILVLVFRLFQTKSTQELADELLRENEAARRESETATLRFIENSFARLSQEALIRSKEDFLQLATEKLNAQTSASNQELDGKKQLIDQELTQLNAQLQNVSQMVQEFERDRALKFGELSKGLENVGSHIDQLNRTTTSLQQALADNRSRGQWGERIAEDILQLIGFVEKINYFKQKQGTSVESRPDFTFLLPQSRRLNMDVKFPYENYTNYLNAAAEVDRQKYMYKFLRDVRNHVKAITEREYINPEDNTLDYVLMFVPNEQVYRVIHEEDSELLHEALQQRVVMCSPITLFAVLAVIKQAVDNFALERSAMQIVRLLDQFNKQWGLYKDRQDKLGKQIDTLQRSYQELAGARTNQLEKPLQQIEELKTRIAPLELVKIPVEEVDSEVN